MTTTTIRATLLPTLALLVVISCLGTAAAQGSGVVFSRSFYAFENVGERIGIGAQSITALAQDDEGFLWIGTVNGVHRFDGYELKTFGKNSGLPSRNIRQLIFDPAGNLWTDTRDGPAYLSKGVFHPVNPGEKHVRHSDDRTLIPRLAFDKSGNLYFAGDKGLQKWSFKESKPLKTWTTADGLPKKMVNTVFASPSGLVYAACGRKVFVVDPETDEMKMIPDGARIPDDDIVAINEDKNHRLWIRTRQHLVVRQPGEEIFYPDDEGLPYVSSSRGVPYATRDGELIVPLAQGIFRKTSAGTWDRVSTDNGLPTNDVWALLEDREGALWIGLGGFGLVRWPQRNNWQAWTTASGLPSNVARGSTKDEQGRVWLATERGLSYWNEDDKLWIPALVTGQFEIADVAEVAVDAGGTVWAWDRTTGIYGLDGETFDAWHQKPPEGWSTPMGVQRDLSGQVWVGFEERLAKLVRREVVHQIPGDGIGAAQAVVKVEYEFQEEPLPDLVKGCVRRQEFARGGVIWGGGSDGLARYEGGKWERFDKDDGLKLSNLHEIAAVSADEIWVTYKEYSEGVTKVSYADGVVKTTHYSHADGLASDLVYSLGVGPKGHIWVGGDAGVSLISPEGKVSTLSQRDGLIWNDLNSYGLNALDDESMYIGTSRGISIYRADAEPIPPAPPKTIITEVFLAGETKDPSKAWEVEHDEGMLNVKFACLSFDKPEQIQFRYSLEGFEDDFTISRNRNTHYSKLPPGKYRFLVSSRSAAGVWSKESAAFSFVVKAPWWENWWFRAAAVLVVLGLGLLIYVSRSRQMKKRAENLSLLAWERTKGVLEEQIIPIRSLATSIADISRQITGVTATLSAAAAQVTGVAKETDRVTNSLRSISETSKNDAVRIVEGAEDTAMASAKGLQSVEQATKIMHQVRKESQDISASSALLVSRLEEVDQVIDTVKGIADTSLVLSINASIEAAHAGDSGKGFAVVAGEIGELASESKNAAQLITEQLTDVQRALDKTITVLGSGMERTEVGVDAVSRSGDILKDLSAAVQGNSRLAKTIEANTIKQGYELEQISSTVTSINDAAVQNEEVARSLADTATQLSESSEKLLSLIANWQTPEFYK